MTKTIYVLNGPNLNLLGLREPEIYGSDTLADAETLSRAALSEGFDLVFLQSNHEGQLVDWIQEAREKACGLVINPAGFTTTSIAILDALKTLDGPVIEVHVSNIHKREKFRHASYVSLRADGVVAGFGIEGYAAAVRRVCGLVAAAG